MTTWNTKKFSEVAESIQGGGTPSTNDISYWNGNVAWLTPAEITNYPDIYISNTKRHITDKGVGNSSAKVFEPNTVLMTSRATIGTVVLNSVPMATNQGFINIKPKKDLNPEFLYFWINANRVFLESQGTGSTFKEISKGVFKNLEISYPEIEAQKNIVYTLTTIRKKLKVLNKQIQHYRQLKQSLMEKLFTEGLRKEQKVVSEEGLIPQSWVVQNLYEIADYTTGKLDSNAMVEGGEYPFFTCAQETFAINDFAFDQEALLLAGNNARGIYSIKYYKGKFNAYQRTYVISIKNTQIVKYAFLKYVIQRKLENLRAQSLGSTTKYITATILKNIKVLLPSVEEQSEIAESLDILETKIQNSSTELKIYEKLFNIVLNKLMNQEIDVSNLEFENA